MYRNRIIKTIKNLFKFGNRSKFINRSKNINLPKSDIIINVPSYKKNISNIVNYTKIENSELEFISKIGDSNNSKVYKVRDNKNKFYILKEIEIRRKRCALREINILKRVKNNKHFPNYVGYIEKNDKIKIVMEYNGYTDLFNWVMDKMKNEEMDKNLRKEIFFKNGNDS